MAGTDYRITDFKMLGSYNWLSRNTPTILVPGGPRTWERRFDEPVLFPDQGDNIIDLNADRYPSSPMEPIFRTMFSEKPTFCWSGINLVTDRKPLSLLLGFVREDKTPFEFQAQVIGSLVVFTRERGVTRSSIGTDFQGYRQQYESTHMQWPVFVRDSIAHHRIVSYKLGDTNIVLRYAADACEPGAVGLDFGSVRRDSHSGRLHVLHGGRFVHQRDAAELTTRSANKQGLNQEYYVKKVPELWLSQTSKFILARYTTVQNSANVGNRRAVFESDKTNVLDAGRDTREWEDKNQDLIRKFSETLKALLNQLLSSSSSDPNEVVLWKVVFAGSGEIELDSNRLGTKLPADIMVTLMEQQHRDRVVHS